jgi:hypothetical protein
MPSGEAARVIGAMANRFRIVIDRTVNGLNRSLMRSSYAMEKTNTCLNGSIPSQSTVIHRVEQLD